MHAETTSDPVAGTSKWKIAALAASLSAIALAQAFTPDDLLHWHYIFQRLFYVPIIFSGLLYGWRGGTSIAVIAALTYLSYTEKKDPFDLVDRCLEAGMFCLVGTLSGVLSDRERRQRLNLKMTAQRLEEVYLELQRNVEHVKRAARMSALGHLSAGLAHEIRNPLASIEGAAFLAESETDPDNRKEFLAIIVKEAKRLNGMVTHFLEFARPRSPELQETDVSALVDSVVRLVSRTAAQNRVAVLNRIDAGVSTVECDPEQLKQVILNLVLNAIQAMPSGGTVAVDAMAENEVLSLSVTDEGEGISTENVDAIFDPFFTTKANGTGLGLPIAYQIIQQHGGELVLEANGLTGCKFTIRMPVRRAVKARL